MLGRARPADNALHAHVLLRLGTARMADGGDRLTAAMLHFHQAYALLSRLLGDKHPLLATALERLAAGHMMQLEHNEAEAFAQRALTVLQNHERPSLRALASVFSTLAAVALARGAKERAAGLAQQALDALLALGDVQPSERAALEQNVARLRA